MNATGFVNRCLLVEGTIEGCDVAVSINQL
jgi:hypothetical protein